MDRKLQRHRADSLRQHGFLVKDLYWMDAEGQRNPHRRSCRRHRRRQIHYLLHCCRGKQCRPVAFGMPMPFPWILLILVAGQNFFNL